jgi:predicted nucleic acid-binding protein
VARTRTAIRVVVCDAGPLIHLDELGCLFLLANFSEILVPDAVWTEVSRHRPTALTNPAVSLQQITVDGKLSAEMTTVSRLFSLHSGELEALQVGRQITADLLLTDDTAARLAARHLAIPVHGTLGILLRAIRRQQLTTDEVLAKLHILPVVSTLHVKSDLLRDIIQQVNKSSD